MRDYKFDGCGFTLIEMVAVMCIIGIIFSITMPTFGPMINAVKVKTAADNLANTLESARQCAVTYGTSCYVVFPPETLNGNTIYRMYKVLRKEGQVIVTVGKW